jgi:hypothetical protein
VLPLIDSRKVGSHPLVSQLLWGIFNLRPPQPKYSHTWKVSHLLGYIKSLGPNENLSLKNLSFKLVTLLGLTGPDRSSDHDLQSRAKIVETSNLLPPPPPSSNNGSCPLPLVQCC